MKVAPGLCAPMTRSRMATNACTSARSVK
jgi:hypothetical protein